MRSIRLLIILAAASTLFSTSAAAQQFTPELNQDPQKAVITAEDVRLFWSAYDLWLTRERGVPDKLADVIQYEYLNKGSQGVKDFIPGRIRSAPNLAKVVLDNRESYESIRASSLKMETFIPEIRQKLVRLKELYPDAKFPAVHFVVGAGNSGGTSTRNGLIIGAEMFGAGENSQIKLSDVVPLVVHELVHFQQQSNDSSLLRAAIREGAADFIAELVSGRHIDEFTKPYGDSHEQELWTQFQKDVKSGAPVGDWMYTFEPKTKGWPRDLGYYMGYKICQSYYQISTDKKQALITIIEMKSPEKILADSAYEKRFQ